MAVIQPSPTQLLAAVKSGYFENTTMTALFNDWSNRKKSKFNGSIQQGYIQGKSTADIVDGMFGTKKNHYVDGLAYGTRNQLNSAVRTSLNHVSSVSRELTYEKNKSVIKGVQWVSTLDGATTVICMGLDGKVDYYDGEKELQGQRPPAHYGCRSTTVPVVKSLKELGVANSEWSAGTRASMNGSVSAKETYSTWFAKQSAGFQKSTLGKGKYELYKSGKYKLTSFSDNGTALSLKQLKAVEKATIPRNYNSNLAIGIGRTNYDAMHDKIDNCGNNDVAKMWGDWENKINVGKTGPKQSGYYSAMTNDINFDLASSIKGDSISKPYQTIFYESGHAIDNMVGLSKKKFLYSSGYENGLFPQTIKAEVSGLIDSYKDVVKKDMLSHATDVKYLYTHRYIRPTEYQKYLDEGIIPKKFKNPKLFATGKLTSELKAIPKIELSNLSDILEGATNGKIKLGAGHGTAYWDKAYKKTKIKSLKGRELGSEAFAEMIDSSLLNGESLDLIKKYLPKSYRLFKKMIKEI